MAEQSSPGHSMGVAHDCNHGSGTRLQTATSTGGAAYRPDPFGLPATAGHDMPGRPQCRERAHGSVGSGATAGIVTSSSAAPGEKKNGTVSTALSRSLPSRNSANNENQQELMQAGHGNCHRRTVSLPFELAENLCESLLLVLHL